MYLMSKKNLLVKTATRKECHKNGYWHRAVYAFMYKNKKLKITAQKTTQEKH